MGDVVAFFKAVGAVLVGVLVLLVVAAIVVLTVANPWIIIIVVVVAAILAVLGFVYVVHVLLDLIGDRRHRANLRKLEYQAREDEIIGRRAERACVVNVQAEQFRLQAMQNDVIRLRQGEVLLQRRGLDYEPVYQPPLRPGREVSGFLVEEPGPPPLQIEVPRREMPDAMTVLREGLPAGGDLLIGFDASIEPVIRPWKKVKAILILGLQGGGKTSTIVWFLLQIVLKRGRLGVIDKHARSEEESLYSRIRPLKPVFDVPVGDIPQSALRVIAHARKVLNDRLNGASLDYPFMLVVDEFTAIMRQLGTDEQWAEVAKQLAALIEDYNTEGRKHLCYALCAGQAANASRAGGTEVRDLFNTRIVHRMRAKQAQMLALTEFKEEIERLNAGEIIVDMETDEPFFARIPLVDDEVIQRIGVQLEKRSQTLRSSEPLVKRPDISGLRTSRNLVQPQQFNSRSLGVQTQPLELNNERVLNGCSRTTERLTERAEKVLELKKLHIGKQAIIEEIWGAKKGGSAAYKQAVDEYERIVRCLVETGKLQMERQ